MVELLLFPQAECMVMVLSLEDCSHRLGGDGSLIAGLFPQEVYYKYIARKSSKQDSFMCTRHTWGCFALQHFQFRQSLDFCMAFLECRTQLLDIHFVSVTIQQLTTHICVYPIVPHAAQS